MATDLAKLAESILMTPYAKVTSDADNARDAARYRWLREQMGSGNGGQADVYIRRADGDWDASPQMESATQLDGEIDACMRGTTHAEDGP